jgi:septum formation protein
VTASLPSLILASASPRRREILTALRIEFDVVVPEVQELTEGDPERVVIENARRKARAVNGGPAGVPVLGVDTEVVLDGRVLGKATDRAAARTRLKKLSGRTHEVLSGVVLAPPEAEERRGIARSEVAFRSLDEATIEMYLDSGEWRDRAGAYAIQGLGSVLVARVEGDLSNVIGLPVRRLLELAPELFVDAGDSASPSHVDPQS